LNVWHALGLLAVMGIVLGVVGGILWGILVPSPPRPQAAPTVSTDRETSSNREAMQINFNRELLSTSKPCAIKTKNLSDVSACSLFGLQLGMRLEVTKHVIDGSGYFRQPTKLVPNCTDKSDPKCAEGYIYQSNDGFTVQVNFVQLPSEAKTLFANRIQLIFGPGGNPYLDPATMRELLVKIFGPPDRTIGDHLMWGGPPSKDDARAYPHKGTYWVALQRLSTPQAPATDLPPPSSRR
jgi:hypothetical protein